MGVSNPISSKGRQKDANRNYAFKELEMLSYPLPDEKCVKIVTKCTNEVCLDLII
jgi:hypothetical protein